MSNQIFPKEIIDNSVESNFYRHSVKTNVIYSSTLIFITAALGALPFIKTDVSVRSQGIIQPVSERYHLTSLVSGKIQHLHIQENESINRGQKIAEIAAPLLEEKLAFNIRRQQQVRKYLNDLSIWENADSISTFKTVKPATAKYHRSLLRFKQQVHNIRQKIDKAENKFWRDKQLFKRGVLSKAAYEQSSFSVQSARSDLQLLLEQQLNEWQSEQISYREEFEHLKTEEDQLNKELEQYTIRAPISGTIQNMKGLYKGSLVYANQTLAEISPDTGLIAECYIPPKDIGLIREGMEARFRVSAFDYNQWGTLTGKVQNISNDVTVINNRPVFTVRSILDQTYLELKNGYRGELKKGMTIQARFTITRRSLLQLLYDNVNDWLNPQWSETKAKP